MTLFRKVFQPQARPATPGDALDEASLRSAFREVSADKGPFVLDRVAQVKPLQEAVAWDDDALPQSEDAVSDDGQDEDEADWAFDPRIDGDAEAAPEDDGDAAATVAGIAAALRRAESLPPAEDAAPEPADVASFDQIETEDDIDGGHVEDRAERLARPVEGGTSDGDPDGDEPPAAEVFADAEPRDGGEAPAGAGRDTDLDTLNLTAFAQKQMQALNTGAGTVTPRRTEPLNLSPLGPEGLPGPAEGRVARRAGRVKTRLLGFNRQDREAIDPLSAAAETTATAQREKFPVGWLVVVEGPGVGHSFSLFSGASMIGRGEDQGIRLDFGDTSISRQNHAAIAYDEEHNKFYLGHGGKSNIIRRNARPVLSTEELHHADLIRIGETTLRFVALCGSDFQWNSMDTADASGV
jgi:hypothetical protein